MTDPRTAEQNFEKPNFMLQVFVDEYLDSYQLEADEGTYTPNEQEKMITADAVHGLIASEEFCDLVAQCVVDRQARRTAAGDCMGCGAPAGDHWGQCDGKPAVDFRPATPPPAVLDDARIRGLVLSLHPRSETFVGGTMDDMVAHVRTWLSFLPRQPVETPVPLTGCRHGVHDICANCKS